MFEFLGFKNIAFTQNECTEAFVIAPLMLQLYTVEVNKNLKNSS